MLSTRSVTKNAEDICRKKVVFFEIISLQVPHIDDKKRGQFSQVEETTSRIHQMSAAVQ